MGNHKVEIILELMNRVSQPMRDVVDKFGQLSEKVRQANSTIKTVPNSIEDLRARLDRLTISRDRAFRADHIVRYNSMIRQTQRELQRLENMPPKSFMDRIRQMPGSLGMIAKGAGVAFVASKVGQFIGNVVKATGQVERYKLTLETMLGSKAAADARMSEYKSIAAKTPFNTAEVVELGNGLQALGRYSKDNVTMLGDLAAAAGKPIDQVQGAYAKLATGQKGEAVNMFRDLLITTDDWVKATGKGVSKNGELMATTEEMLAALPQIMSAKHFDGMMEKQSQGIEGKISNIQDALTTFMEDLGEMLKPWIDGALKLLKFITDGLSDLLKFIKDNKDLLSSLAIGIGVVTAAWAAYKLIMIISSATTYATIIPAIKAISLAIYNIPIIGWIAAIIAGLIALGVYLWKTSAVFRGFLYGMWEAVKTIFGGLGGFMTEVLGGIWDLIKAVFNPATWFDGENQFGAALDRIKNAATKYGKAIGEGYSKGMVAGKESFEKKDKKTEGEEVIPGTSGGTSGDGTKTDDNTSTDVGGITSGGSKPTNITINLGKLQDNIVIHSATLKEGVQDMEKIVTEALLRILNSGNAIQTGGG